MLLDSPELQDPRLNQQTIGAKYSPFERHRRTPLSCINDGTEHIEAENSTLRVVQTDTQIMVATEGALYSSNLSSDVTSEII